MPFLLSLLVFALMPMSEVSAAVADTQASYQTAFLYFLPDYGSKEENNKAEIRGCRKIGYTVTRENCAKPRILKDKCPVGNVYKECFCAGSPTCTGSTSSAMPYSSSTGAAMTSCVDCPGNTLYTWTCNRTCGADISSKPSNSSYTTCTDCSGSHNVGWSCNTEYVASGNSCVCAKTCSDTVTSKPANSSYTTSSCTACGVTTSIKTGWSCNSGYKKSGSSCVKNCSSSSSNWCPVHRECHTNCCTDGTIQPCDPQCGGSGCSTSGSGSGSSSGSGSGSGSSSGSGSGSSSSSEPYCSYPSNCRGSGGTWLGDYRCSAHCYILAYTESNYRCVQDGSSWVVTFTRHTYCFDDAAASVYRDQGTSEIKDYSKYSSRSECETAAANKERSNREELERYANQYSTWARYRGYWLTDISCR